jgi:hypothetical protein
VVRLKIQPLRNNKLNPPDWTKTETLEFPGSVDEPWKRYVHEPDARGIDTVRYPRLVAKDATCADKLKKRTLTNLYNESSATLACAAGSDLRTPNWTRPSSRLTAGMRR